MEDEFTITMEQITEEAGHRRVSPSQIVDAEKEIYQSLNFKIYSPTVYEEVCHELVKIIEKHRSSLKII